MTKADLINLIANIITGLDNALMSKKLLENPPKQQLVYAVRNHLDDQQRKLLLELLNEENADYQTLTATIQAAANSLNAIITNMQHVDEIVNYVTRISADLDQVLKLVS